MAKRLTIGKLNLVFVFRHRFEKEDREFAMSKITMWRTWELGLFFRKSKILSNNSKPLNNLNLTNCCQYMFGLNLLLCKMWFTVDYNGMHIKLK